MWVMLLWVTGNQLLNKNSRHYRGTVNTPYYFRLYKKNVVMFLGKSEEYGSTLPLEEYGWHFGCDRIEYLNIEPGGYDPHQ